MEPRRVLEAYSAKYAYRKLCQLSCDAAVQILSLTDVLLQLETRGQGKARDQCDDGTRRYATRRDCGERTLGGKRLLGGVQKLSFRGAPFTGRSVFREAPDLLCEEQLTIAPGEAKRREHRLGEPLTFEAVIESQDERTENGSESGALRFKNLLQEHLARRKVIKDACWRQVRLAPDAPQRERLNGLLS